MKKETSRRALAFFFTQRVKVRDSCQTWLPLLPFLFPFFNIIHILFANLHTGKAKGF
jgi:hypothetical protein